MTKAIKYILLFCFLPTWMAAQSINTEFGKNRVQYHDNFYSWWKYETQNFITYWYGKGRNIAQSVIQLSELDHDEIQTILEHRINDKIEIIVYTDISDLLQSNIGIEDAFTNKPKKTKVVGNKIFVYFNGNHQDLRKQIRKGIANVYLNSILIGSNFQDFVHNALLLNLPEWYVEGIIAYAGSHWDSEIDDEFRDIVYQNDKYFDWKKLARDYPRVAGHSFWFYVDQKYGKATIANIIYLTRLNRQIENSFKYLLGESFENVIYDWAKFYEQHYAAEKSVFEKTGRELDLKNKPWVPVSKLKISPDGKYLAYAFNDLGKFKVFVRDLKTGEEKLVLKHGVKNVFQETDYNYPLIAWHPTHHEISLIYEHRDILYLRKHDVKYDEYEEQSIPENFQRILSLDYIRAEEYLFAGVTEGYSDLYTYKTSSRSHTQITDDYHDDLNASYITYKGEKGILFSSNRPSVDLKIEKLDTILPIQNFDLFFLVPGKRLKDHKLIQLSKTPSHSEMQAFNAGNDRLIFLSNKSGVTNRYIYENGSSICNSNKDRNIMLHHVSPGSNKHVYTYYHDGAYKVFTDRLDFEQGTNPYLSSYQKARINQRGNTQIPFLNITDTIPAIKIDEGQLFQSEFEDPEDMQALTEEKEYNESSMLFEKYFSDYYSQQVQDGKRVIKFNPVRASSARRTFRLFDPSVRVDNEPLFEGLQSYIGEPEQFNTIPIGILLRAEVKDLFEDFNFIGGARYPFTFNGSEYFMVFERNKKLLDHRISFYRKVRTQNDIPELGPFQQSKTNSILGMYSITYPFDVYRSVRFTLGLRFDKYFQKATDALTLNAPRENEKRISFRAEYIYDSSFDVNINIKNGTRYKAYFELLNEFNFELSNNSNVDLSSGLTAILGYDARHYIPLTRFAVLALRSSGAASIGSKRMLYYVGGVENWISPKFDESIPLPLTGDFSYSVLAPQIRGFKYNIRNGSNYFVNTAELRLPIFQLMGLDKLRIAFLKNLQVVGFADAGLAWFGLSPYSDENQLNTISLETPPVIKVEVEYFRDPMVYGYGFGFRTTLLGYFLKFDYAWGVDTRTVREPSFYFSLGYDF